ncbi:hypothetical protein [Marinoscillum sp.]|uniref:hypothetical protein n=1 Tax=Marinoscillum sp. TaxID=2024838 RepID=UPI003BAA8883
MRPNRAKHRLEAGVLSYVLSIGILVSVGLSMLILYVYYSRIEYKTYERKLRVNRNLHSAMQLTLGAASTFDYQKSYYFDLYDQGTDSVQINKYAWGLLDLWHVMAVSYSDTASRWYTQANTRKDITQSAIFLVDDGRPLSLSGKAKLEGDCYLPVSGVQSAYIDRVGYQNEELVYGEQLKSDKELPDFTLESYFDRLDGINGQPITLERDTIRNSFDQQPLVISNPADTLINVLLGNVLVKSRKRIVFDSLSSINEGALVTGSVIELRPGFQGSGQFLATDTLFIRKDVKLTYPTILAVFNEDEPATIVMEEGSEVNGWLLIDGEEDGFRRRVIYIEDGAKVIGMVYCNGLLESYGTVNGHATVKRFLVNSMVGVYENYILNATYKGAVLDSAFLGFENWFTTAEGQVLDYLY